MKAILTNPPGGGVEIADIKLRIEEGLKLRTLRTGICGTDKEIVEGRLSFARPEIGEKLVLGHEALAVIEDPGSSVTFRKGDIVVPMVRRPGKCKMCRLGRQDYCEDGDFVEAGIRGRDGFMREEFYDKEKFLVKVEDKSIEDLAVLTEPLKNVMKMVEIFNFQKLRIPTYCDDSTMSCKNLYVFGTGTEGLLISAVFKTMGLNVIAVNRHPPRETVAKFLDSNNITYLDTSREPISSYVKKFPMDFAIDAVGSMDVMRDISLNISRNGIVILFGTSGQLPSSNYEFLGNLVDYNVAVVGSVDGAKIHYSEAIQFITNYGRKMGFGRLITGIYSPEETNIFTQNEKDEIKKVINWS